MGAVNFGGWLAVGNIVVVNNIGNWPINYQRNFRRQCQILP